MWGLRARALCGTRVFGKGGGELVRPCPPAIGLLNSQSTTKIKSFTLTDHVVINALSFLMKAYDLLFSVKLMIFHFSSSSFIFLFLFYKTYCFVGPILFLLIIKFSYHHNTDKGDSNARTRLCTTYTWIAYLLCMNNLNTLFNSIIKPTVNNYHDVTSCSCIFESRFMHQLCIVSIAHKFIPTCKNCFMCAIMFNFWVMTAFL